MSNELDSPYSAPRVIDKSLRERRDITYDLELK